MKLATWNVNSLKVRLPQLLDWLAARAAGRALPAGTQDRGREVSARGPRGRRLRMRGQRAEDLQRRRDPLAHAARRRRRGHSRLRRRAEARHRRHRAAACAWSASTARTARRSARTSTSTSCAGSRRCAEYLAAELQQPPAPRGRRRFQRRAGRPRRARPEGLGRPGARLGTRARRLARAARARAARTASACSSSRRRVYSWWDYRMMGFRRNAGLRIDHDPALAGAGAGLHRRAASTRRRASSSGPPTTRR